MQWSKLKKRIEGFLANSVKNHVQLHVTSYGHRDSSTMSRGWITWDKEEIANFSTVKWMQECYGLAHKIREVNDCMDFRAPDQREGYYISLKEASRITNEEGIFSRFDFYDSLLEYLVLSADEAFQSDNPIIQALSMFDRRIGKRRLQAIETPRHPLVSKFYALRCKVEDIPAEVVQ